MSTEKHEQWPEHHLRALDLVTRLLIALAHERKLAEEGYTFLRLDEVDGHLRKELEAVEPGETKLVKICLR